MNDSFDLLRRARNVGQYIQPSPLGNIASARAPQTRSAAPQRPQPAMTPPQATPMMPWPVQQAPTGAPIASAPTGNAQVSVMPPQIPPQIPSPRNPTIYKELMQKHDRVSGARYLK